MAKITFIQPEGESQTVAKLPDTGVLFQQRSLDHDRLLEHPGRFFGPPGQAEQDALIGVSTPQHENALPDAIPDVGMAPEMTQEGWCPPVFSPRVHPVYAEIRQDQGVQKPVDVGETGIDIPPKAVDRGAQVVEVLDGAAEQDKVEALVRFPGLGGADYTVQAEAAGGFDLLARGIENGPFDAEAASELLRDLPRAAADVQQPHALAARKPPFEEADQVGALAARQRRQVAGGHQVLGVLEEESDAAAPRFR